MKSIQDPLADLIKQYREKFHDDPPQLDFDATDKEMCDFLLECLCWNIQNPRDMGEHDLLELQYQIKFPDAEGIPLMMIHMTESKWRATMRECLRTGKPYELPADVRRLVDEGAIF